MLLSSFFLMLKVCFPLGAPKRNLPLYNLFYTLYAKIQTIFLIFVHALWISNYSGNHVCFSVSLYDPCCWVTQSLLLLSLCIRLGSSFALKPIVDFRKSRNNQSPHDRLTHRSISPTNCTPCGSVHNVWGIFCSHRTEIRINTENVQVFHPKSKIEINLSVIRA